ncbi:uncharacterized protein G2W53_000266 [Senna tora]|uniref:Uncharacterized protein n=1 Tax=Senna tora TaxID=362788 RepID=A0A835CJB9_9FABA|nr:uncharacterized protein G2W53_000266 [Senna tora]
MGSWAVVTCVRIRDTVLGLKQELEQ